MTEDEIARLANKFLADPKQIRQVLESEKGQEMLKELGLTPIPSVFSAITADIVHLRKPKEGSLSCMLERALERNAREAKYEAIGMMLGMLVNSIMKANRK